MSQQHGRALRQKLVRVLSHTQKRFHKIRITNLYVANMKNVYKSNRLGLNNNVHDVCRALFPSFC